MDLTQLIDAAEWKPITTPWDETYPMLTHHATIELRGQQVTVWKLNDGRVLAEVDDLERLLKE